MLLIGSILLSCLRNWHQGLSTPSTRSLQTAPEPRNPWRLCSFAKPGEFGPCFFAHGCHICTLILFVCSFVLGPLVCFWVLLPFECHTWRLQQNPYKRAFCCTPHKSTWVYLSCRDEGLLSERQHSVQSLPGGPCWPLGQFLMSFLLSFQCKILRLLRKSHVSLLYMKLILTLR